MQRPSAGLKDFNVSVCTQRNPRLKMVHAGHEGKRIHSKDVLMNCSRFAKQLVACTVVFGTSVHSFANERLGYDKCILASAATAKDRYALAAVKRACFNLHFLVRKVPQELWGKGIQLVVGPVQQRGNQGVVVGTEGWHQITVINDTPYRLSAIKVIFFSGAAQQTFELMNHPFTGINDIDFMHVLPHSQNDNYYVDLRNLPKEVRFKLVEVFGVRE